MSWESVVDDEVEQPPATVTTSQVTPPAVSAVFGAPAAPPPPIVSLAGTGPTSIEPITFAPLTLDPPPSMSPPMSPSMSPSMSLSTAPAPSSVTPIIVDEEPPVIQFAPLVPIVPALGDLESGPNPDASTASTRAPTIDEPSTELPEIVEATPVPDSLTVDLTADGLVPDPTADPAAEVALDPAPNVDAAAPTHAYDAGPRLPQTSAPERVAAASPFVEIPQADQSTRVTKPKRRGGRGAFKLLVALFVLGGLVAAGIVFGRPYLFPGDWDSVTEPFAEAVETARGVEFIEPLTVIGEPTTPYTARMSGELTGEWSQEQPMWRALGLISGSPTEAKVAEVLAGWQDSVYSTDDGQVYRDEAVTGPQADAQIMKSMTAASLDQEFGWSTGQPSRTLDDAAQTSAEVERQARAALAASPFAVALDPVDPALLGFAPPVIGYKVLAPATFAEFATQSPANPLGDLATRAPGPLPSEVPVVASNPTMNGTDVVVTSPRAMDRSFWYLVFAGFLDSRTAYNASEAVVESAVTLADRGATRCVYSTFSGGDTEQTATLRAALEMWSASAATTLSSTFSILPDGSLQLVSCDPGAGVELPLRLGVARELIGWRMAELATIEAVNGTAADLESTWAVVEASNVPVELAALPGQTTPADAAAAARAAVGALLTPAG